MDQVYAVLNVFLQIFKVNIACRKGKWSVGRMRYRVYFPPNWKLQNAFGWVPCKSFCQANGAGNSCPFISFAYQKYRRRRRQAHKDVDEQRWRSKGPTPSHYAQSEIYAKFSYWAQGHTRKFSKLHLASKIAASMHVCVCLCLHACVCSWDCLVCIDECKVTFNLYALAKSLHQKKFLLNEN